MSQPPRWEPPSGGDRAHGAGAPAGGGPWQAPGAPTPSGWERPAPPPGSPDPRDGAPGGGAPDDGTPDDGTPADGAPGGAGPGADQPAWGRPPTDQPPWAAPRPGIVPLRPLSLGEIFDGSFRAIRTNPATMLGVSAVVVAITAALSLLPQAWALQGVVTSTALNETSPDLGAAVGDLADVIGTSAISGVISFLSLTVLSALLTVAVSGAVLGRRTSVSGLWQRTRGRLLRVIGLALLSGLLTALAAGTVLAVGLGGAYLAGSGTPAAVVAVLAVALSLVVLVLLYVRWSMAAPALLLEEIGIWRALRRSWRVTRSSFWRVLGILLLTAVIAGVASAVVRGPFGVLAGTVADGTTFGSALVNVGLTSLGSVVAQTVLAPFQAGVAALLYMDLRMRREGLDVELIRASGPGPAATPGR